LQIRRVGASVHTPELQRAQRLDARVPAEAPPPQQAPPARSWRAAPQEAAGPYRAERLFSARDEMESRMQASAIAAVQQMSQTRRTVPVAGAVDLGASVTRKLSQAKGGDGVTSDRPESPPSSDRRTTAPTREGVLSILQGFL